MMRKIVIYQMVTQCTLLVAARADFLVGQEVRDVPLELLSTLSDIKSVDTRDSILATDLLVTQIFFKNWDATTVINGPAFSINEIEFEWIVSVDVDGDLNTGTKANHPFPGSDYEVRAQRRKESGGSMNSTIGPNIMTSQLWQYIASSNSFVNLPLVVVTENSFSTPINTTTGAPAVHWFRMQCPVPGLAANSRLGVQTYHRIPPFDTYRDYTEQNASTYLPFIKTTPSLQPDKIRLTFENLSPQVRYGVQTSADLRNWNLVGQVFIANAGDITSLVKTRVTDSSFYRAVILPD
jgi:hypothetical protein